jgi:hypothetical protein
MGEIRIKHPVTVQTAGEELAGSAFAGILLLIATAPLWGLPAMGSAWLGLFVHFEWKWHPVFAIAASIVAFFVPVFFGLSRAPSNRS